MSLLTKTHLFSPNFLQNQFFSTKINFREKLTSDWFPASSNKANPKISSENTNALIMEHAFEHLGSR